MQNKNRIDARQDRKSTYDGVIAAWWQARAGDSVHQRAYRNIADYIHLSFPRSPRLIVDYACGAGQLLAQLSRRFDRSRMVGLDGSSHLLALAKRRISRLPGKCARRVSLIQTPLPNLGLMRGSANLVIFCFPNMVPFRERETPGEASALSRNDLEIARRLSMAGEPEDGEKKGRNARLLRRDLEYGRAVSRNLRRLLVSGGICVRVEYAASQRHEWSSLELERVCFAEGTLDARVDGRLPRRWFRVLASAYFRSRVMEDVYQQTGDIRDRNGGYLLTVLRAV